MYKRKNVRFLSLFLLVIFIIQFFLPFLNLDVANAATSSKKTIYIEFENGDLTDSESAFSSKNYYSAMKQISKTFDVSGYVTGTITNINVTPGSGQTLINSSYNGSQVSVQVQGKETTLYGQAETNPGHRIYRTETGDKWEHTGENTATFLFTPDDVAAGSSISTVPGLIPSQGYIRSGSTISSTKYDYNPAGGPDSRNGNDLRYYSGRPPKGLVDIRPNWNMNGSAVTRSYDASPAQDFYTGKDSSGAPSGTLVDASAIVEGSKKIVGASSKFDGIEPYSWVGKGENLVDYNGTVLGTSDGNQIAVRRILDSVCKKKGQAGYNEDDCQIMDFGSTNNGQLNNYVMIVYSDWQATTYQYTYAKVEITYEPPTYPDFTAVSISADKSCYESGDSITLTYKLKNNGIDTNKSFDVEVLADGVTKQTETYQGSSIAPGITMTKTFTTTINNTTEYRIYVDRANALGEASGTLSNNQSTVNVSVSSSCGNDSGKGLIKGTLTISKPSIPWGDDNKGTVNVDDSASPSCKAVTFKILYMDENNNYYNGGSYKNLNIDTKKGTDDFEYDPDENAYPGGIGAGTVTAWAGITDSCGGITYTDEVTFEIQEEEVVPPPVDVEWFRTSDLSTPISTAIVGEKVAFKITSPSKDEQGRKIKYSWDFNSSTQWIADIPSKYGLSYTWSGTQLTNILADVVDSHYICVTGSNGVSNTYTCAKLQVKNPNPIPVITGADQVKENRLMDPPLSVAESYSPVLERTIDFSKDMKTGVWKDRYDTPGTYDLTLEVFDNTGLKSLPEDMAHHRVTVIPDLPPVPKLTYKQTMIRGQSATLQNLSYSPDGDEIEKITVKQGYDSTNSGVCTASTLVSSDGNPFTFTPTKVGKYCLEVYAKEVESYGKSATQTYMVDVINDAPDASFTVKSENPIPEIPVVKTFKGSDWYSLPKSSLDNASIKNNYIINAGGNIMSTISDGCTFADVLASDTGGTGSYSCPETKMYGYSNQTLDEQYAKYKIETNYNITAYPESQTQGSNGNDTPVISSVVPIFDDLAVIYTKSWDYKSGTDTKYHYKGCQVVTPTQLISYCAYYSYTNDDGDTNTFSYHIYVNKTTGHYAIEYERYNHNNNNSNHGHDTTDTYYTLYTYSRQHELIGNPLTCHVDHYANTEDIGCGSFAFDGHAVRDGVVSNNEDHTIQVISQGDGETDRSYDPSFLSPDIYLKMMSPDGSFPTFEGDPNGWITNYIYFLDYKKTKIAYNSSYYMNPLQDNYRFVGRIGDTQFYTQADAPSVNGSQIKFTKVGQTTAPTNLNACPALTKSFDNSLNKLYSSTFETYQDPAAPGIIYIHDTYNTRGWDNRDDRWRGEINYKYEERQLAIMSDGAGGFTCDIATIPNSAVRTDVVHEPWTNSPKVFDGNLVWISTGTTSGKLQKVSATSLQPDSTNEQYKYGMSRNLGQISSNDTAKNLSIKTSIRFYGGANYNTPAGLSFRIQNNKNMYRVEVVADKVNLLKIVNGRKTLITSAAITVSGDDWVDVKVRAMGDQIKVYIDSLPLIITNDSTFSTGGKFGPFAEAAYTEFKTMTVEIYSNSMEETLGKVIVDEPAIYDKTVTDPENDPIIAAKTKWTYTHTNYTVFKDVGDGKYGYVSPTTRNTENPVFTKVGIYKVGYQVEDDPQPEHRYPDNAFDSYRKWSATYQTDVTVHRRPVGRFTLSIKTDYTVAWNDTSYDPDRCDSNLSCQSGYVSNHGIFERKYYYVTPSGKVVAAQLTRPTESGAYSVYLAVKDEFGAWSDWVENTVNVTQPLPNTTPTAALTFPTGTQANPTKVSTKPTITWNQADSDPGTIFTAFNLHVSDESGNCVECISNQVMNTKLTSWSWTLDATLALSKKYQAKVQVSDDSGAWSAWSNIGWMSTNTPPAATMIVPSGTQASPTMFTTTKPTLKWSQTDTDPGTTFKAFQIQITNEANTTMILDSGQISQSTTSTTGSWMAASSLPVGQKLRVRVRVYDGSEWSNYSSQTWMMINNPPVAAMTVPNGTQANPTKFGMTKPTLKWSQTDADAGTTFSYFQLQITNEANDTMILDSGQYYQGTTSTTGTWTVPSDLPTGQKLRARVRVYDGYEWSAWSPFTWLFINNPPVADFDWSPKPVWEGDTVTLSNLSSDADGDPLTYEWTIRAPDASTVEFTSKNPSLLFQQAGDYTVTLSVSDGIAASRTVKTITALPLTIQSDVSHTAKWLDFHQKKGHQTTAPPKDFYSGEVFVVATRSSPAPVAEAKAWIDTEGLDGSALYVEQKLTASDDGTLFEGELFDEKFQSVTEGLPEGLQQIHFQIRYSNGVVRTEDIPVRIIGNVNEAVGVHRVQ